MIINEAMAEILFTEAAQKIESVALYFDGNELLGGGYERLTVSPSDFEIVDGNLRNSGTLEWDEFTSSRTFDEVRVFFDNETGYWKNEVTPFTISSGKTPAFTPNSLSFEFVEPVIIPSPGIPDGQYLGDIKVADVKTYILDGQTFIVVDNRISTDKIFSADIDPAENLKIEAFLDPGLRISIDTNFDPHIEP